MDVSLRRADLSSRGDIRNVVGLSVIVMSRQGRGLGTRVAVEPWRKWGLLEGVFK